MKPQESNRICRRLFPWSPAAVGGGRTATALLALLLLTPVTLLSRTGDYLSAEEIEDLRNSQKPHKRMAVLNDIFQRRVKGAMASRKAAASGSSGKEEVRRGDESVPRSFTQWMQELVMCLEEIETNLENYPVDQPLSVWDLETGAPIRMDHKKFRKALKEIRSSLLESNEWLLGTLDRLESSEGPIAEEAADFLTDLAEALKETIELAGGKVSEKIPAGETGGE